MTFLASLWSRAAGYVAALGALVAILFGAWLKGRAEGMATMREEQERHRREALTRKRKLDSEIDNLGPADRDQRVARWVRKDGR